MALVWQSWKPIFSIKYWKWNPELCINVSIKWDVQTRQLYITLSICMRSPVRYIWGFFCLKLFYNAKNNCRCNFTFLFYIILIDVSCIVWLYVFFRIFSIELPWQQNARYEKRLYLKNVQQTLKCLLTFKR